MFARSHALAAAGLCLLLAGCEGEGAADDPAPDPSDAPTWHQDIAPLIHRSCVGCHQPDGIGQFSMRTFAEAAPLAGAIANSVATGRMPPWGARSTDDCTPRHAFEDDIRLSAGEVALLTRWVDGGALGGDPATAAELPTVALAALDGVQQALASAVPFTTVGTSDQFRCFVLDPGLTEDAFVDGIHIVPGNPLVVHHALVYIDQGGEESSSRPRSACSRRPTGTSSGSASMPTTPLSPSCRSCRRAMSSSSSAPSTTRWATPSYATRWPSRASTRPTTWSWATRRSTRCA